VDRDILLTPSPAESLRAEVGMSNEVDLLLCCARSHIDSESAERMRTLLRQNIDWDHLIKLAQTNRVMPLLYRGLDATCPHEVPDAVLDQLKNHSCGNAERNLFLARELVKFLRLLEAHHISAMPFKGPVLAVSAYTDLGARQAGDLDILVHVEDAIKTRDLLLSVGFEKYYHISDDDQFRIMNHFEMIRRVERVVVEIHWELMPRSFHDGVDMRYLWEHPAPVSLAGDTVFSFPINELMLFLCAHGAKHSWMRLSWICDVAELIRARPELDLEEIWQQARTIGSERIFLLALHLANRFLGVTLPDGVLRGIQRDPIVRSLASEVYAQRLEQIKGTSSTEEDLRFYLSAKERSIDKFRCCRSYGQIPPGVSRDALPLLVRMSLGMLSALQPNDADIQCLNIPRSLYFLYYFVRPLRLIAKFALSPSKVYRKIFGES
jgi:hypothetical protein